MFLYSFLNSFFFLFFYKYILSLEKNKISIENVSVYCEFFDIDSLNNFLIFQSIFLVSFITGRNSGILKIKKYKNKNDLKFRYNLKVGVVLNDKIILDFLFWFFCFFFNYIDKKNIKILKEKKSYIIEISNLKNVILLFKKTELLGFRENLKVEINFYSKRFLNNDLILKFILSMFKVNLKKIDGK